MNTLQEENENILATNFAEAKRIDRPNLKV
jgi:hypothetical protein